MYDIIRSYSHLFDRKGDDRTLSMRPQEMLYIVESCYSISFFFSIIAYNVITRYNHYFVYFDM
jgi:hypothetical protein